MSTSYYARLEVIKLLKAFDRLPEKIFSSITETELIFFGENSDVQVLVPTSPGLEFEVFYCDAYGKQCKKTFSNDHLKEMNNFVMKLLPED